jgi:hypothetical protein
MKQVVVTSSPLRWILVGFLLIGGLSDCGEQQANSASAPPASTVIPHSPTPLTTLVPPKNAQGVTVTMADDGRQVHIKLGQTILFALDDVLYDQWTITFAGPALLAAQPKASLPPHTQALYKAIASGQTSMIAKGDLVCAKVIPPCQIVPQDFQIQVTIE